MSIDLRQFHASFFSESLEGLDATEANLLRLEGGERSPELLNAIFRAIHSIKGAAGSLGFPQIGRFTHEFENVLDDLRKGRFEADPEAVDIMLACVDHVRYSLRAAQQEKPHDPGKDDALLGRLAELRNGHGKEPERENATPEAGGAGRYRIRFRPAPGFFASGNDVVKLFRVLDGMGTLAAKADLSALPEEGFDPEKCYLAWALDLETERAREEIADVFGWVEDDCELEIEGGGPAAASKDRSAPALPPASAGAAPAAPQAPERRGGDRRKADRRTGSRRSDDFDPLLQPRSDLLHVGRAKLDGLMNAVGELVITKTILKQILSQLPADASGRFDEALQELEHRARELQDSVMSIRMQPMSFAFGRFPRLVRDLCQASGKLVQLRVSGEASELDSTVIEKLVDPLTHLVRNALDHGIEPPAERVAAGKMETATLSLHAEHRGGNIEIVVADDGRGINRERVRAKAVELGLVGPQDPVGEEQAHDLIFSPGFSTAERLNELSGRGVGLDVVRKNVSALNGTIKVESEPGRGTRFVIRLPLTLAIVDGMRVAVADESYILPLASIVECVRPGAGAVRSIAQHGDVLEIRGEYLPLVSLGKLFGAPAAGPDRGIAVVLEADGERMALLVDALLGQEQVVIKTLEANYRKIPCVAGATILGEGRVVLILDVGALVRSVESPQYQN
ncbi:MAG: chemotaxis protein CheA [Betaproteobacteria bacterium]|nr:chemotaxis protein CheA [Betaproteobacteria bacterium]